MTEDNEILAWIRLAKGDVEGHSFHGNQYSQGHALYERSGKALHAGAALSPDDRQGQLDLAHEHAELAHAYLDAKNATTNDEYGHNELGHRYDLTSKAHNSASKAWQAVYESTFHPGVSTDDMQSKAVQASQRATMSGMKGAEEAAAVDHIFTSQITKGDTPGHDFHGNQYTAGKMSTSQEYQHAFGSNWRAPDADPSAKYTPESLKNVTAEGEHSYGVPVTDTAAKLMHITNDQIEDGPNGLGSSRSDAFDAKVAGAIPKWLSSGVTQADRDALTDQNYHMTNRALDAIQTNQAVEAARTAANATGGGAFYEDPGTNQPRP